MKAPRRAAWIFLVIAMLIILALGFYRAARHEEPRPESAPATAASTVRAQ